MADIYLLIEGQPQGPFTEEKIRQSIAEGLVSPHAQARREGTSEWTPLADVLPAHGLNIPPLPPPITPTISACPVCGTQNKPGASFCSNCGARISGAAPARPGQPVTETDWRKHAGTVFENISGHITTAAGVEKVEGLSGKEFLSGVLKKRSDDEIEQLFITGTSTTTPTLADVDTHWPKPWAFFKAMLTSLIVFGGFYYGSVELGNENMIPGAILVGSFAIPFSLLVFFIEMNVARNMSVYQIMKLVFMGGVGALLITLLLDSVFTAPTDKAGQLTWGGAIVTGLVEEAAKVLAAIFFMAKRRFFWTLNGLLIGSAIGTGFAAFESAGYALQSLLTSLEPQQMIHEIELRAVLAPGGHVVWAALSTAALWKVKGEQPFRWEMLKDKRFWRVFLLVASLHALWDCPLVVPFFAPDDGATVKDIILGIVAWIAIFGYIQDGLKQIRQAQAAAGLNTVENSPTVTPGTTLA
jgi:RsiW-degrading membrane proteinase PrsW (M82 family)